MIRYFNIILVFNIQIKNLLILMMNIESYEDKFYSIIELSIEVRFAQNFLNFLTAPFSKIENNIYSYLPSC